MKIQIDSIDVKLYNSKTQDRYDALQLSKRPLDLKYEKSLLLYKKEIKSEVKEILKEQLSPYYADIRSIDTKFFFKNPNSVVTGFLLQGYYSKISIDSLKLLYNRINDTNEIMGIYKKDLAKVIAKRTINALGNRALEFKTLDIKGDSVKLSQFRGKYILLDFWASWCIPCREKNPELVKLYKKYKDEGFEIIGITDDRNMDSWKNAVKYDSLPWLQISSGRIENNKEILSEMFDVHYLPTTVLIDKNGYLIDRYIGVDKKENTRFEKKLNEIFKN